MAEKLTVILAICSVPLYAQGAQPDAANLNAEARSAVGTIGPDKHKTQIYCQILELERQLADQEEKQQQKEEQEKGQRQGQEEG